ncbi:hypothetical protein LCGC14_1702420 [marine sediment metagenome]|uniref:Phage ABA sandwich domain-containing protein n=1 Tax=marine sediment metagenome TaxID=412755 RepID=A0A0F9HI07_9ZZZZ
MTENEIIKLTGLELNEAVAVEVMGLPKQTFGRETLCPECSILGRYCGTRSRCSNCNEWYYSPYRDYYYDIQATWEIVEKLNSSGFELGRCGCHVPGIWRCWIDIRNRDVPVVEANTAPLAICRAALLAVRDNYALERF